MAGSGDKALGMRLVKRLAVGTWYRQRVERKVFQKGPLLEMLEYPIFHILAVYTPTF